MKWYQVRSEFWRWAIVVLLTGLWINNALNGKTWVASANMFAVGILIGQAMGAHVHKALMDLERTRGAIEAADRMLAMERARERALDPRAHHPEHHMN